MHKPRFQITNRKITLNYANYFRFQVKPSHHACIVIQPLRCLKTKVVRIIRGDLLLYTETAAYAVGWKLIIAHTTDTTISHFVPLKPPTSHLALFLRASQLQG
jgi:hypothetical protein